MVISHILDHKNIKRKIRKMIEPQLYQSQSTNQTLLFLQRPFIHGIGSATSSTTASLPLWSSWKLQQRQKVKRLLLVNPCNVQANSTTSATTTDTDNKKTTEKSTVKVKAVVKVKITMAGFFSSLRLDRGIDDITDLLGKSLLLELVSSELDPGKFTSAFFFLSEKQKYVH